MASRDHSTDSHQDQQDNRSTFVKIRCANLRKLRSDFGRTPSPRSAVFTVPTATEKVLPLPLPLHRKRLHQVFHRQVRGVLPVEDARPLKIIYGEFSQNTVRLPACPAGDIVANSEKDSLNYLYAVLGRLVKTDEWQKELEQNVWENVYKNSEETSRFLAATHSELKSVLTEIGRAK